MTFPASKITEGRRVTVKRTGLGDGRQRHGSEPRVREEQCALVCRSHVMIGSQRLATGLHISLMADDRQRLTLSFHGCFRYNKLQY